MSTNITIGEIRSSLTPLSNRQTDDQRSQNYNREERFQNPNPNFTGFIQGQANLNTGKVAGYCYNTHTRVTVKNPSANQNLEDDTSLLNQKRNQNYDKIPSPTPNILPIETTKMPQPPK